MMDIINQYLTQIILTLLLAFCAFLGAQARNLYKKYITTEIKQSVCRTAVRFVEQVYIDIHGPEKLAMAMGKASSILAGYGITISEEELIAMLEAAVNEFNNAFSKDYVGKGRHETGGPIPSPAAADPEPPKEPNLTEIIADLKDVE